MSKYIEEAKEMYEEAKKKSLKRAVKRIIT